MLVGACYLLHIGQHLAVAQWHQNVVANAVFVCRPNAQIRAIERIGFGWNLYRNGSIVNFYEILGQTIVLPICKNGIHIVAVGYRYTIFLDFVGRQYGKKFFVAIDLHYGIEFAVAVIDFGGIVVVVVLVAVDVHLVQIGARTEVQRHFVESVGIERERRRERCHPVVHLPCNAHFLWRTSIRIPSESVVYFVRFASRYRVWHAINPNLHIDHLRHSFGDVQVQRQFVGRQQARNRRVA